MTVKTGVWHKLDSLINGFLWKYKHRCACVLASYLFAKIVSKLNSETSPAIPEKAHVIHRAIIFVFIDGTWHDRT